MLNGTSVAIYGTALQKLTLLAKGPKEDLGEFFQEINEGLKDGSWFVSAKVRNCVTILLPLFDYFDFYRLANDKHAEFPQWSRLLAMKYPTKDELKREDATIIPLSRSMHDPGYSDLYTAEIVWCWNEGARLIIPKLGWARKQLKLLVSAMTETLEDLLP